MQKIVRWLEELENQASVLYREAALLFRDDPILTEFLTRLSEDEVVHARLMHELADYLQDNHLELQSAFQLSQATLDFVESPLKQAQNLVAQKALSKKQMIDLVVSIEYHEWNNVLFRYIVTTMKPHSKKFQHTAAVIQAHEERIQQFLDVLPRNLRPAREAGSLPVVWRKRFLVVDDDEAVRELLSRILARRGTVETAANGKEALEKMKSKFFDAVITDVDMPVMDGPEFFQEAIQNDPGAAGRFVFCAGRLPGEIASLHRGDRPRWIAKPFSLPDIDRVIDEILVSNASV